MKISIQDAINTIIAAAVSKPYPDTVDIIKVGDPSQPLTGIAITFLANYEVIEQAKRLNANLIIVHEPIFYNHLDKIDWLQDNKVYQAKRNLIESNNLVIWRFHDYMHSIKPDPVGLGLVHGLGWESYLQPEEFVCHIPAMKLRDVVDYVKRKLNIRTLRIVGDLDQICHSIRLFPEFPPAEWYIQALNDETIDVVICGEIHEWETSEFTRDAMYLKQNKALIVIGHAAAEEPGIRGIIPWLQARLPGIPIHFIPTSNPFQYL